MVESFLSSEVEDTPQTDPLPHLLTLHNRSDAVLTDAEKKRVRDSVVAASFGRDWSSVQIVHRKHFYQETRLKRSPENHLVFHLGEPIRVRLGFDGTAQTQTLTPGGLIIIPREIVTDWRWDPLNSATPRPAADFLHLYLKPDILTRVAQEMEADPANVQLIESLSVTDPVLWRIGETLRAELRGDPVGGRLIAEAAASQLAVHLLRRHATGNGVVSSVKRALNADKRAALTPRHLRLATEFIRANLHRDISLADIAGVTGISVFHFARLFKNATGQSPYQYLTAQRIALAKELLQQRRLSIGHIAYRVGYDSHSRFTAQFRRLTGVTPAEFRAK